MGWICPECGLMNAGEDTTCSCGFDQAVFLSSGPAAAEPENGGRLGNNPFEETISVQDIAGGVTVKSSGKKTVAEPPRTKRSSFHPSDQITLKEIGTWRFSLSPSEKKISIGTAALEPFRLDLTVEDMENILEAVYEVTGTRKTLRSLELMDKDILELIEFIVEMTDAKRSKIRPSFSPEDMGAIAALVNGKLSQ